MNDFFKSFADPETELPLIDEESWQGVLEEHGKDDVKKGLCEYIIKNKVPFPYRNIPKNKAIKRFKLLRAKYMESMMIRREEKSVFEKYEFKYNWNDFGIYAITIGNAYNAISDYFQNRLRMKCNSYGHLNAVDRWEQGIKMDQLLAPIFRLNLENRSLKEEAYRKAIRLSAYVATQFRPSVAKFMYDAYGAETILDTSMGWGDRLAGFWCTPTAKEYVGFDPNPETFEIYKEQCIFYHKLCGGGSFQTVNEGSNTYWEFLSDNKHVQIHREPSEDVDWWKWEDYFDMSFTSPPYFSTERYGEDGECEDDQSWKRYSTFESWRDDFFLPTSRKTWNAIKDDGYMCVNITEPKVYGTVHKLCDDFVDSMKEEPDCNFLGQVGMRMMQRPNITKYEFEDRQEFYDRIYTEPIWMFRKNNSEHPELFKRGDLSDFLH